MDINQHQNGLQKEEKYIKAEKNNSKVIKI